MTDNVGGFRTHQILLRSKIADKIASLIADMNLREAAKNGE